MYVRLKEPLCCKLRHRIIDDGLRGLVVVLAVVTIISTMLNAYLTDDDSESCSGTVAMSIVAATAEHDESSAEDQLLFLKVRRDAAADVSLTFQNRRGFLRFPPRLRTPILSQTIIVVVIVQELKTSIRECKQTKTTLFVAYTLPYTLPVGTIAASLIECQSTTIVLHSFRTMKMYIHRTFR